MLENFVILISATALLLGSPGPAPLALAATGATFGFRNGLPFLMGILSGLLFVIIGAIFGLATLFSAYPQLKGVFQLAGASYMLYIAYRIATAPPPNAQSNSNAPSFRDGFILNLLNPKAYAAFLAIFSQFLLPFSHSILGYLFTALTCLCVATIVDMIWLAFGGVLRPIFSNPKQAVFVRRSFALLLIVAVALTTISTFNW